MGVFSGGERRYIGDIGNPLIPQRPDGRTTAGVVVTADSAMTLSAMWACVRLRADLASTLPLLPYRDVNGEAVQITPPPLLAAPGGERMCLEEWLYQTQVSLDLRGNSFGVIVARDGLGFPKQIELVHPDLVNVAQLPSGELRYRIAGKDIAAEDVYHERQFTVPGQILGLSPVLYHARTIGVGLAAEKFGADWFSDGAHPSSVLMSDQKIDESQARTIKARFTAALRGNREPAVLGAGLKYQAIQVSANESQFLDTMRYSVAQVARIYGIPPEMVGGSSGSSMTYANIEQRSIDFLVYGIGPTLVRRERAFSRMLPTRQYVRYDLKALLRTDAETRYRTHALGIAAKFLTPDEARHDENLPPLTAEQKAVLELVPLAVAPSGKPKDAPLGDSASPDLAAGEQKAAGGVEVHVASPEVRTPDVHVHLAPSAPSSRVIRRDEDGNIVGIDEV